MRLLLACCCCLLLLLLKRVAHPWPLKGGVKPRQGKPSSVINAFCLGWGAGSKGYNVLHHQQNCC